MHNRAYLLVAGLLAPVTVLAQQRVQLPARDRLLSDKPVVVYAIGREDGEEWEILSGVLAVAFDSRDNLYVLDSNNFRVLVFDAAGKFVRSIGRRGEGPGELMAPTGVTVMTDGTVVVSDGSRHAFSLFKDDGTFIRSVAYGEREGVGGRTSFVATGDFGLDGVHAHPRGGIVAQIFPPLARGVPTGVRKVPVKRIDLASGAASVLYEFTLPPITPKVTRQAGGGVSITSLPTYWTPGNTIGVLPGGGIAVAHEALYRVKVVDPAGQVERILERPIAPRRGSPADKEAFLKRQREALSQGGAETRRRGTNGSTTSRVAPEVIDQMIKNATWMELIPVLRRVTADPQNRIWAARSPTDFGVYGPVDILRAEGTYIGTVANAIVPSAVSRSGRAAYIERDQDGVERVTVKRLPASWQ